MNPQYSTRSNRPGVVPPTATEYAIAKTRGLDSITGEQLRQMRSGHATPRPAVPAVAVKRPLLSATDTPQPSVKQLRQTIVSLRNEIARLKVKVMTGR